MLIIILVLTTESLSMDYFQLPNGKTVVFLNADEGYAYIHDSKFITDLTRLDVSLRLKKDFVRNDSVDYKKEYLSFLRKQMKDWNGLDKKYLKERLKNVSHIIDKNTPSVFPDTLLLIRTTGDQEFSSFYTVKNAIISPGIIRTSSTLFSWLGYFSRYIEEKLIHEIYHIYSRYNPAVRQKVYSVLGFDKIDRLGLNINLRHILITNPDDHDNNYKIGIPDSISGKITDYCLLIQSKYPTWIGYVEFPARIMVLLVYLDLKLHPIEYVKGSWVSVLNKEGKPIVNSLDEIPEFFNKIGIKLPVTLSPEEIAAETFVILIKTNMNKKEQNKKTQAEQELLKQFQTVLNE